MDKQTRVEERQARNKNKKKQKAGKTILIIISIIVIALAAFVLTVKLCRPDFDFKILIPSKVSEIVSDIGVGKKTTAAAPQTTQQTTIPVTEAKKYFDYADFSDFAFDTSKQGNQIGNLMNKSAGAVTYNSSYIFFGKPNGGIYRFAPAEETNKKITTAVKNPKCLNILGDNIYFINSDTGELLSYNSSSRAPKIIGTDIAFCYGYNDSLYYITNTGTAGYIVISTMQNVPLYTANGGNALSFVGISLSRLFLTSTDMTTGEVVYICVSLSNTDDVQEFMGPTQNGVIAFLQMENGFMYYYSLQADGTYDLLRQKFGSKQTVVLLEQCSVVDYPVICRNRLYYSELDGDKIKAKELNMNSMKTKTMVTASGCDGSGTAAVGFGYQYIFIIGTKTGLGDTVYKGSCIYTSSSKDNTMTFKDGKWEY